MAPRGGGPLAARRPGLPGLMLLLSAAYAGLASYAASAPLAAWAAGFLEAIGHPVAAALARLLPLAAAAVSALLVAAGAPGAGLAVAAVAAAPGAVAGANPLLLAALAAGASLLYEVYLHLSSASQLEQPGPRGYARAAVNEAAFILLAAGLAAPLAWLGGLVASAWAPSGLGVYTELVSALTGTVAGRAALLALAAAAAYTVLARTAGFLQLLTAPASQAAAEARRRLRRLALSAATGHRYWETLSPAGYAAYAPLAAAAAYAAVLAAREASRGLTGVAAAAMAGLAAGLAWIAYAAVKRLMDSLLRGHGGKPMLRAAAASAALLAALIAASHAAPAAVEHTLQRLDHGLATLYETLEAELRSITQLLWG